MARAPDMESMAQSTMSAPACAHASCVATPVPAVSCVCTCSTCMRSAPCNCLRTSIRNRHLRCKKQPCKEEGVKKQVSQTVQLLA